MGRAVPAALLIALAGPASAAEGSPTAVPPAITAAPTTLRVAVPDGPDAVAGFDRGLFAEAARDAGLGVVFDVMSPAAALDALDAGRVDVAAGPYPPEAATSSAPASAPTSGGRRALASAAADGDALLKRRGDGGVKAPEDAAGKLLGLVPPAHAPASAPGSAPALARLRAEAAALGARPSAPRRAFADPLGDLAAGRVAALLGGVADLAGAALAHPDGFEVVGPVVGRARPLAALLRADRPELAGRLDAALGRMRADGRLAEVQRRWFGLAFGSAAAQPGPPSTTSKP